MEPGDHWREVYAARRPDEVSWFQASPLPSLDALARIGAKPSQSLVDIGGGASALVDALLDRGWHDLTVVDIAAPALAASQARLGPRAEAVVWEAADIRSWSPGRSFDLWHDRAAFHFLTDAADRAAYRRALDEGTHAGSHVIIATFALDGLDKCSGLPVRRYDAEAMAAELGRDFTLVADWHEAHLTPWSTEQRFQWAIFRRG